MTKKAKKPARTATKTVTSAAEANNLPAHIGFIVDGNRRWARERSLPTFEGHKKGLNKIEVVTEACFKRGVKCVSCYIFSTENWGRSQEEVDYLMDLVKTDINRLVEKMRGRNIRCVVLGSPQCPRPDVFELLEKTARTTEQCDGGTLCFCFNYGGQREIAEAAAKLLRARAEQLARGGDAETLSVTEEEFAHYLYHPEVPPVDLVVRTSGEERISGFMLWRSAYAEFLFLPKYFPEMTATDVDAILAEFESRQRRFGK